MPARSVLTGTKSDPNLTRGPLPREQALAFLKDVVDIAFPRLVQNGYYLPDTVRSCSSCSCSCSCSCSYSCYGSGSGSGFCSTGLFALL